jgi:hypothetical protein
MRWIVFFLDTTQIWAQTGSKRFHFLQNLRMEKTLHLRVVNLQLMVEVQLQRALRNLLKLHHLWRQDLKKAKIKLN